MRSFLPQFHLVCLLGDVPFLMRFNLSMIKRVFEIGEKKHRHHIFSRVESGSKAFCTKELSIETDKTMHPSLVVQINSCKATMETGERGRRCELRMC